MELNQTTLRGILAAILSVSEKYVVPKQGNWFNPQEADANIENWCAYQIRQNRPRTLPFYNVGEQTQGQLKTKVNGGAVLKIADIDLQFVGPKSEELANSVAFWSLRSDVQAQFKQVQGAIMNDQFDAISSIFSQDGNNTVMAWNTTIRVQWYSILDTNQGQMPGLYFQGKINRK
ncbi:MAG: hypothetical protein IIZ93_08865 [Acidaminococcaceae bacterium]|nr:hypothetical protein [Acidaminococcaceae bacterium]